MHKIQGFFLCCIFSTTLVLGQIDPDIEKRIEEIIALVTDSQLDAAVGKASELVAAHHDSYEAHRTAFQTNFAAFQGNPDGPNGSFQLETALKHLDYLRRLAPLSYEAWELSLSFWNPGRLNPRPQKPETAQLLAQTEAFLDGGETEKAVEALKEVIQKEPEYVPAQVSLGEIYFSLGEYAEALRIAEAATEKDRGDPVGFLLVARSNALLGDSEEAIRNLIHSLEADPSYPPAWQLLTQLNLGGANVEHMALHFPKSVLWAIDQGIEEPAEEDLQDLSELSRLAWRTYIAAKVQFQKVTWRRDTELQFYRYSFREELTAIIDLLLIWTEISASNPEAEDVLLDHWLAASDAGAVDAAIFVDFFLEQNRHDFTMWKLEYPGKFEEYFYKFVLPRASSLRTSPGG